MAIQINSRIAAYAAAATLAVAGAAIWFLFFEDAPPAVQKPPATKAGGAGAGAVHTTRTDAAVEAAAPKPAPIPTEPDKLVAEILEASGLRTQIPAFGAEVAASALAASQGSLDGGELPEWRLANDVALRHFDPAAMAEELANGVKSAFEAERMGRFLELLRPPAGGKQAERPLLRPLSVEDRARLAEQLRKNPPPPARQKLVQALDEVLRLSDLGVHITTLSAREMVDGVFEGLQGAGRRVSKEARQAANAQIGAAEPQIRNAFRALLFSAYQDASDEELGEYLKRMDSETGRWGWQILATALRSALEKRARPFGRDLAQLVVAQQLAGKPDRPKEATAPAAPREAPKAAPVAATPAEPPAYQRPAHIRPLYARYNDLVTAVVMRDAEAVRELLADGKDPNARQSDGLTALMIAVANGDAAIAELLLAHRADPNLRGPGGRSALAIARERNRTELVRLLERHGARG